VFEKFEQRGKNKINKINEKGKGQASYISTKLDLLTKLTCDPLISLWFELGIRNLDA